MTWDGKAIPKNGPASPFAPDSNSGRTNSPGRLPPLSCADCKLGKFAIYGPVREAKPDQIYTRRRSVLSFQAGKTFLREGERLGESYTLYSGWAFRFKQTRDGRRQILSFLLPGDSVLLESLCFPDLPMPFSVKTLTPITVCTFILHDMISLTTGAGFHSHSLATAMREHQASLSQRLIDIGRKSALGRVAQLILELEDRLNRRGLSTNGQFEFPIRQEHLADALGLTTVYVNRTLDRLRKRNVIDLMRNQMIIKDARSLARIAEFE